MASVAHKYAGLPGIDASQRDTYETSDIEASDDDVCPPVEPSDDVLECELDPLGAAFRQVDFGGSVVLALGTSGYRAVAVPETNDQRLARIARELAEIGASSDAQGASEVARLERVVATLQREPEYNEYHQRLDRLFEQLDVTVDEVPVRGTRPPLPTGFDEAGRKLAALEAEVGGKPLNAMVADLGRKIHVVSNPEYAVDQLQERVKALAAEYDRLVAKKKVYDIEEAKDPVEVQIEQLYRRLPQYDATNALVPGMVSRLRTLAVLHHDVALCVNVVEQLDETLLAMALDFDRWNQLMDAMDARLREHERVFEENRGRVEERLAALEKKGESRGD